MFRMIPGQMLFVFVQDVLLLLLWGFVLRHEELHRLDLPENVHVIKSKLNVINSYTTKTFVLLEMWIKVIYSYRNHSIAFCIKKHKCFLEFANKIFAEGWFSRHFMALKWKMVCIFTYNVNQRKILRFILEPKITLCCKLQNILPLYLFVLQ